MLKNALRKVVQTLDQIEVPYALIGGLAVATYGAVRATENVDLLIDWPLMKAPDLVGRLARDGQEAEFRKGDFDDPVAGVICITVMGTQGPITVDLLFPSRAWQKTTVSNAAVLDLEGFPVRVARAEDLFLLKLYAGGPQDLLDAAHLYEMQAGEGRASWKERAAGIGESDAFRRCLRFLA